MSSEWRGTLSLFPSVTDTKARQLPITWAGLAEFLELPKVRADKGGELFSAALFTGNRRKNENAQTLCALVLDYDHAPEMCAALAAWQGVAHIAYTTWSHGTPDKGHAYRVIVPLSEPIPAALYPALWALAHEHSGGAIDAACKDPARIQYLPAVPEERRALFQFVRHDGPALDWRALNLEHAPAPKTAPWAALDKAVADAMRRNTYIDSAVADALRKIATAPDGTRNATLNAEAYTLGQLVAADWAGLSRGDAERALSAAATTAGLAESEALPTIKSGLDAGGKKPRPKPAERAPREIQPTVCVSAAPGNWADPAMNPGGLGKPSQNAAETSGASQEGRDTGNAPSCGELPEICISFKRLSEQSAAATDALVQANNPARLFNADGRLMRLSEVKAKDGTAQLRMVSIDKDTLRYELERAAIWTAKTKEGGKIPKAPPENVAKDLLAAPDYPDFPLLARVVTAPCVTPSGRVVSAPGYDKQSGIFYFQSVHLCIPDTTPNPERVAWALALIDDLLFDFPLVTSADKAHCYAMLILPFVRDLIAGPTPLHFFTAPQPRTGKSKLAEAISKIFNPLATLTVPPSGGREAGEEWAKRILSCLQSENPHIWFDNIKGEVENEALEAALLSWPFYSGRVLGSTNMTRYKNDRVWVATGNNAQLGTDMTGRAVEIRLDANVESPELRGGFKHPDILGWVENNRANLTGAVLVLVRNWLSQGRPEPCGETPNLGGFESWRRVIGGILSAAGVPGFLMNRTTTAARVNVKDEVSR